MTMLIPLIDLKDVATGPAFACVFHQVGEGAQASQKSQAREEEKKEEESSANVSKKIQRKKIPFSTARFASIRFRPWHAFSDWIGGPLLYIAQCPAIGFQNRQN